MFHRAIREHSGGPNGTRFLLGNDRVVWPSAPIAEDLAQEVMITVYSKVGQVRDHALFRAWAFRIARNTLSRHYTRRIRQVETVDLSELPESVAAVTPANGGAPAFEFNQWIAFLDCREKEALALRFIEEWEYHEIAAAQNIPIGTVQWRVFNAKRKLAQLLLKPAGGPGSTQTEERGSVTCEIPPRPAAPGTSVVRKSRRKNVRYGDSKASKTTGIQRGLHQPLGIPA
jgi:RNA polymerase sigma factor (sigma-70 family)